MAWRAGLWTAGRLLHTPDLKDTVLRTIGAALKKRFRETFFINIIFKANNLKKEDNPMTYFDISKCLLKHWRWRSRDAWPRKFVSCRVAGNFLLCEAIVNEIDVEDILAKIFTVEKLRVDRQRSIAESTFRRNLIEKRFVIMLNFSQKCNNMRK